MRDSLCIHTFGTLLRWEEDMILEPQQIQPSSQKKIAKHHTRYNCIKTIQVPSEQN